MGPTKKCAGPCGRELPRTAEFFHGAGAGQFKARCRDCRDQSKTGNEPWTGYKPPPLEAIPEGFEVASLATKVDGDGKPTQQFIGARPERGIESAIIDPLQPGHTYKRVSTLTDANERVILQWKIATQENEDREKREKWLLDAIGSLAEKWPVREPVALESPSDEDLMCVIPMGDPHFGMYSWAAETGDDYDLQLAQQYHCTAMKALVDSAPPAARGLLINLGDFFHMDNSANQTLRGHHQLDVDTRWPKVIRSGVHATVWLINYMLTKFGGVDAWMVPGNHDPHSAFMLQLALSLYFKDEPRVKVADVAGLFYYLRFGDNLIASTHTHTIKDRGTLGEIMAADRKEDWGATEHRFWYCGHVHHDSMIETRGGVVVETMRTLAGKDKFAAESGYRSGRDMKCDVYDRKDGRIQRNVIGIRQIQRMMDEQRAIGAKPLMP